MAIGESILFAIDSTNYANTQPFLMYKPQPGNSGFVTTLRLTVNIKSIKETDFPYIPDNTPFNVIEKLLNEVALNAEFKEIIIYCKKGSGAWLRPIPIKIFNKEPFYEIPLVRFYSDANTIDVGEDFSLGIALKTGSALAPGDEITIYGSAVEEARNPEKISTSSGAVVYDMPSSSARILTDRTAAKNRRELFLFNPSDKTILFNYGSVSTSIFVAEIKPGGFWQDAGYQGAVYAQTKETGGGGKLNVTELLAI